MQTRPHQLKRSITIAERHCPRVREAIRLAKGWRRARGKAMRIPSYAIELLMGAWAPEARTLEGLVSYFFQRLAQSDARERLTLLGRRGDDAVTVRDPWSGANVTDELTRDHRRRLVENSRRAFDALGYTRALLSDGRDRAAMTELRSLFIGAW